MNKLFIIFFTISLPVIIHAQTSIIVTPQWLNDHINDADLVIVQPSYIRLDYQREHIKGARFLWPDLLTANSPEGTFNTPDTKMATKVLRDLGINNNSKIVLCHPGSDISITARMFLTLEYLGLKGKVYFLNGGLNGWKKAGYAVSEELPKVKEGNFTVEVVDPVFVDKDYVLHALQTKSAEVVDARRKNFYDGDPTGNPRDGHIAGALNLAYTDMFDSTSTIKPIDTLSRNFQAVLPDKQKEAITYCFIGQTESVIYLTGRSLGYNIKLYDGSMQEWSRIPELPMEKTKK